MGERSIDRDSPKIQLTLMLALLIHTPLLLSGSFRRTYDAYVHIFFADHYARDWFSTWETRWYTGFTTVSYPPGTHQLMALLSSIFGLEGAFIVVQIAGVLLLVIGVYRTSLLWVDEHSARWAALLAVLSTSIAEAVHIFGQLPTTVALGLLLNATPFIDGWLRHRDFGDLLLAITTLAATTVMHHVTTLFGSIFFIGPIVARVLVDELRATHAGSEDGRPAQTNESLPSMAVRRLRPALPGLIRVAVFGVLLLVTLVAVVMPFWIWSGTDPISQVAIPHGSRSDFLEKPNAALVFWVIPWGMLITVLPWSLRRALGGKGWPLGLSVLLLAVLGTGGTTPIPRLLLRGAFDVLTLDRFTFWATIAILPFAGRVIVAFLECRRTGSVSPGRNLLALGMLVAWIAAFLFTINLGQFRTLQPDAVDPEPIAEFLAKDDHDRWRYLTLGMGDQMAWVSAHTTATTVDGNYHSARRLPELVSRPVERLEGAKFRGMPGLGSLQQFVTTPERYNLKFVFSNDRFYDPLLFANGWHRLGTLRNDIVVWERADITPLPALLPEREVPAWQRLLWGLAPMTAVVLAGGLNLWNTFLRSNDRKGQAAGSDARPSAWTIRWNAWAPRCVSALSAVVVAFVGFGVSTTVSASFGHGPAQQAYDYYVDLDFARFEAAWERFDPETRPSLDQYLLENSVVDGLLPAYSKLDRIEILQTRTAVDTAHVQVQLSYMTSLSERVELREHELIKRNGRWYLLPEAADAAFPVEQFSRRTAVDYVDHGRRLVTDGVSDYGDVLDRPRIEVLDSRLVRYDGGLFIVGQLTNVDIDPADITVTGRLLDEAGEVMAEYQAGRGTVHKVRPGETVPFRVAFEGMVTAGRDPESVGVFAPNAVAQLKLDRPIASYELAVKALVTGRNLQRLDIRSAQVDDGPPLVISGAIQNPNTDVASVPIVVAALLDQSGEVAWVQDLALEQSVMSQRRHAFEMLLTPASHVEVIDVPSEEFDNGRMDQIDERYGGQATVELPARSGYAAARLTVMTFNRELEA